MRGAASQRRFATSFKYRAPENRNEARFLGRGAVAERKCNLRLTRIAESAANGDEASNSLFKVNPLKQFSCSV